MGSITQKYSLDACSFTGTSALVCQSILKYRSVVCKIDMLMDICNVQMCSLGDTPPTYIFLHNFFGVDRSCQLLEGDLLNKVCRIVSSTFCFCSFSPLHLKDCLEQIGS